MDKTPRVVQVLINILPLTHASGSLRAIAYGDAPSIVSLGVLVLYAAAFVAVANLVIPRRRNL